MPSLRSTRSRVVAALLVIAVVAAGVLVYLRSRDEVPVATPWEFTTAAWDAALGGDEGLSRKTYSELNRLDGDLEGKDARTLRKLAGAVVRADLTGQGRGAFSGYWPGEAPGHVASRVRCKDVEVLASSPARLPLDEAAPGAQQYWAKILVTYSGTCGQEKRSVRDPGVEYVFAVRDGQGKWAPRRMETVPAVETGGQAQAATAVEEWQLKALGPCGVIATDVLRARTVVSDAFDRMCRAAAKEKVVLVAEAAYRSPKEQAALFARAVEHYGSEEEARKWVAYANEKTCDARACAGTSVSVEPDHAAVTWLSAVVACADGEGHVAKVSGKACASGATAVTRSQTFGFVAPSPRLPGYLEFALPVADGEAAPADCAPTGSSVPVSVASIFRCRLERAGVVGEEVDEVVAQALVVSKCASSWTGDARLFAGRYAYAPNPVDKRIYSQAGVFMISGEVADAGWVKGGRAALTDPGANINGAASLWLATRGWEQFPCATGKDASVGAGPVLPSFGGPELPEWSRQY